MKFEIWRLQAEYENDAADGGGWHRPPPATTDLGRETEAMRQEMSSAAATHEEYKGSEFETGLREFHELFE